MGKGAYVHALFILLILLAAPGSAARAQAAAETADIPLDSLSDGKPLRLLGLMSAETLTVEIPQSWSPSGENWIEAGIRSSELLDAQRSSLTISVNGRQARSLSLPTGNVGRIRIPFPGELLRPGKNTLEFEALMYLAADQANNCANWNDPARWVSFDPGGSLHVQFERRAFPIDLAILPELLVEPLEKNAAGSARLQPLIVLPDDPAPDDLSALVSLAYTLGHRSHPPARWMPEVVRLGAFDAGRAANRNVIFAGQTPPELAGIARPDTNFIAVAASPWDPSEVAVVIGDQDRFDGFTPVSAYSDPAREVLLHGSVAYVDKSAPAQPPAFRSPLTFEQLGYDDRSARGAGTHDLIYRFYMPYDLMPLSAGAQLRLQFAPDLDRKASSVMIFLNGISVAGIVPPAAGAISEPIHVDLPASRFRPGVNYLRLTFDLHLSYTSCTRLPDSIWASVFNDSSLEFSYRRLSPLPSLKYIPLPFSDYPSFSFVVGSESAASTLAELAELSFVLGQSAQQDQAAPDVILAANFNPRASNRPNLVMAGVPSENPAIALVNDVLPQPFAPGQDKPAHGYGVYLPTSDQDASLGLLQIVRSPWSAQGTVLVITGTDAQGLDWVWQKINDPSQWDAFDGNLMLVGAAQTSASGPEAPAPTFQQTADVSGIPIIGPWLNQASAWAPAAAVAAAGAALALAFLVVLIARALGERVRLARLSNAHGKRDDDE